MTDSQDLQIETIEGTAIPVRGDDIDTDRIIPARFLRSVRFEGLEQHLFEVDRRTPDGRPSGHPFDNPAFSGASILLVNKNFGCGSSREHAPQALRRWGIRAVVGESFSEIFFGNATMLGMPCLAADHAHLEFLMLLAERQPAAMFSASLSVLSVHAGDRDVPVRLPKAAQQAFLGGVWDPTALLLERFEEVEATSRRLPYGRQADV